MSAAPTNTRNVPSRLLSPRGARWPPLRVDQPCQSFARTRNSRLSILPLVVTGNSSKKRTKSGILYFAKDSPQNARIGPDGVRIAIRPIVESRAGDWQSHLDVNLTGIFFCLKYEMRQMARERVISMIPIGQMATPEDMGETVLWLCSDAASFLTGVIIPVDGGMSLGPAH